MVMDADALNAFGQDISQVSSVLKNVILTPHTAALTRECVVRMATEAAACVIDVFAGCEPQNIANPQVLESGRWKSRRAVEIVG